MDVILTDTFGNLESIPVTTKEAFQLNLFYVEIVLLAKAVCRLTGNHECRFVTVCQVPATFRYSANTKIYDWTACKKIICISTDVVNLQPFSFLPPDSAAPTTFFTNSVIYDNFRGKLAQNLI